MICNELVHVANGVQSYLKTLSGHILASADTLDVGML